MAKPIHGLLDRLIEQFAAAIALRAEQMFARSAAGRGSRLGAAPLRLCPAPGCKNPGAGPRNRWFCRDHAKSLPVKEQKRILAERAKANQAAARLARASSGGRCSRAGRARCRRVWARFASNAHGVVQGILGGWQLTGLARWTSGFPFSISPGNGWATNRELQGLAIKTGNPGPIGTFRSSNGEPTIFKDPAQAIAAFRPPFPGGVWHETTAVFLICRATSAAYAAIFA